MSRSKKQKIIPKKEVPVSESTLKLTFKEKADGDKAEADAEYFESDDDASNTAGSDAINIDCDYVEISDTEKYASHDPLDTKETILSVPIQINEDTKSFNCDQCEFLCAKFSGCFSYCEFSYTQLIRIASLVVITNLTPVSELLRI